MPVDRDKVSLALARAVAAELPGRPEWIALARQNLADWTRRNASAPALLRCYEAWRALLDDSVETVIAGLTDPSERGQTLRQNSPFAGALSPSEVWRIKREVGDDTRAA